MKKIIRTAICVFLTLGLSSAGNVQNTDIDFSKRNVVNHEDDPAYTAICGGQLADLVAIENEGNMIDPNFLNMSTGNVSLRPKHRLKIEDNSYYTFVIFVSDSQALKTCSFNQGNSVTISYKPMTQGGIGETTTLKTDTSNLSISTPSLFKYGSVENLKLFTESCCSLYIQMHVPDNASTMGLVTIESFDFAFNRLGQAGNVEQVQFYKGAIDTDKPFVEYNHEPCGYAGDFEGPYEDGYIYNISASYPCELSEDLLLYSLKAYDKGDGKEHEVTLVSDDFSLHKNILDTPFDVVYSSNDIHGNMSMFTYRITIYDSKKPSITQNTEQINVSYSVAITPETLLEYFSFSDNYLNKLKDVEITDLETVEEDNFIGKRRFKVKATDMSNNVATLESEVNVIDDIKPVISGEDEICINAGYNLTNEEILSHYSAYDEIDGNTDVAIENRDIGTAVGLYSCDVTSTDSNGNKAVKTVFVQITDSEGPEFYVNKSTITTYGSHMISSDTVVKALVTTDQLPEKTYVYSEFISGNYTSETDAIDCGTYQERVAAHADNGDIEYSDVTIIVKSASESTEIVVHLSFWDKIGLWFASIWSAISNFFARIFRI